MSASKIIDGLQEALDVSRGDATARMRVVRVPENVDVKAIRQGLGMSQQGFAFAFGFSLATVRNWEQGRRVPEKPARMLLKIIEEYPQALEVLERDTESVAEA
ncbi:MAG: helix-turn-helix domain-containing protein [Pseudomonadota bacterium]